MAYTKKIWKDQVVENPRTYSMRDNGDNTVTLLDAFGTVTELGTPVNAANMNHIENGISDVDNSAVHKAGTETITGAKTFTQNVSITNDTESYRHISSTNSAITKGTTPSANTGTDFVFRDSQNSYIGALSMWYNAGGVIRAQLRAYAPAENTADYGYLVIDSTNTGSQLSFITEGNLNNTNLWGASSDTSRNLVALQGWVNNPSMSTNVVHRSGNETIGGTKTFSNTISGSINGNAATVTNGVYTTGNQTINGEKTFNDRPNFKKYILSQTTEVNSGITAKKTNVTKGTAPDDNYNNRVLLQSKDGMTTNQRLASLDLFYDTENRTSAILRAYKPEFDSTEYVGIGVYYPATGDPYTYAHTPSPDAVGNEIITAKWIMPNYSKAVNRNAGVTYTADKDVRVMIAGTIQNSGDRQKMEARVTLYYKNDKNVQTSKSFIIYGGYVYYYNEDPFFVTFDVKAGDKYRIEQTQGTLTINQFIEIPFGG